MGMELQLEQISPKQLDGFIGAPKRAYEYVLSEMLATPVVSDFLKMLAQNEQNLAPEARTNRDRLATMLPLRRPKENGGNLRLLRKYIDPKRSKRKTFRRRQFSLEKNWHVLHYLLNGTAEGGDGLASAILGGTEIPDVEGVMGYGPMRYLTPTQVRAAANALATVSKEELTSRFNKNAAEAERIYLAHAIETPADRAYLYELFEGLREFYADAAARGNAMLMALY